MFNVYYSDKSYSIQVLSKSSMWEHVLLLALNLNGLVTYMVF